MKKTWVDLAKIKDSVRFEDVLEHYGVKMTSTRGKELQGHCPFHDDKNPSFNVNTRKKVFFCFGCGAKGSVVDFVSKKEEVSVTEAAILLCRWFDISEAVINAPAANKGPETPNRDSSRTKNTGGLGESTAGSEATNEALTFRLHLDPDHWYLKDRGLAPRTISHFGLGFCKNGLMKNRIAIPIHDEEGELVAYAGRWAGHVPSAVEKYMLPFRFKKSRVLFNLHRVKGAEVLVIVEGYWSVFRLHQLNIPSVALMGCTLSKTQESLLTASNTSRLILLLDGDDAGRQAQAQILPRLARHFFTKAVELPEGNQPDTADEQLLLELLCWKRS